MKGQHIRYSAEELALVEALRELPRGLIVAELRAVFGRTDMTEAHIRQLCKRRGWTSRTMWTAAEDAVLIARFADTPTAQLAAELGRSLTGTFQRAHKLGLKKSAAFLASSASGRVQKATVAGVATRFQKGHVPANKGLRRKGWAPGRMGETQFRKGKGSHNWMPIGSTRLVDGYEYTKVSDVRNVPYTVNWKATHILRWEAVHGPVPVGHALKCFDGNRLNTAPENWTLVPRGILPILSGGRSKRMRYDEAPHELKPTLLAMAKLTYAMKQRRAKEVRA